MSDINSFRENIFYHHILSDKIFINVTKSEFFSNATIRELFDIAKEHTLKYKEAPSKEQLIDLIRLKGLSEKYTDDILSALYNSKQLLSEYGDEWLTNNIGAWIQVKNLDNVMRKAISYMKLTNVTSDNASDVVEKIRNMISSETSIDFSFNLGVDFFDPSSHLQERLNRKSTGYPYIDLCLKGGYWKGSLIVFLASPKCGKSTLLCNLAAKSILQGTNTAYVTLELQQEIVNMRIGANLLNIPLDVYEEVSKDQSLMKQKMNSLRESSMKPLGNLHVKEFPMSTASANDIEAYLLKSQEMLGYKFENVFIDYLNIMKNWRNPNSENLYLKIKQISEDVRAMGQRNNWSNITVTQTNRSGWQSSDMLLSHIAESAGLLHTVDALFGLITDPEMRAKGEYYIKCLADRVIDYDNTRKRFTIDWNYLRIEEDQYSPIQDMEFLFNNVVGGHGHPRKNCQQQNPYIIPGTKESKKENKDIEIDKDIINATEVNITGNGLFQ